MYGLMAGISIFQIISQKEMKEINKQVNAEIPLKFQPSPFSYSCPSFLCRIYIMTSRTTTSQNAFISRQFPYKGAKYKKSLSIHYSDCLQVSKENFAKVKVSEKLDRFSLLRIYARLGRCSGSSFTYAFSSVKW